MHPVLTPDQYTLSIYPIIITPYHHTLLIHPIIINASCQHTLLSHPITHQHTLLSSMHPAVNVDKGAGELHRIQHEQCQTILPGCRQQVDTPSQSLIQPNPASFPLHHSASLPHTHTPHTSPPLSPSPSPTIPPSPTHTPTPTPSAPLSPALLAYRSDPVLQFLFEEQELRHEPAESDAEQR